ncbi:MAG: hypothetical protein OEY34_05975, partial [Cyclobacteriaceae bacterium]|nr:hypothetical protein [Cyclobacteriaceae bacterium]
HAMNKEEELQRNLFSFIKGKLAPSESLVEEISEVLCVSTDSAYRRIRGEKFLSLPELIILCGKYNIPVDELVSVTNSNNISFTTRFITQQDISFEIFLEDIRKELELYCNGRNSRLTFILNELNLLQLIQIPELACFKFFFWKKSSLGLDDMENREFSFDFLTDQSKDIIREIVRFYVKIESNEMISGEVLNSFLKQVKYYHDAGFFSSKSDPILLINKLELLVNHLYRQASLGYKFPFGHVEEGQAKNLHLYHNDIILVDNLILANYDENEVSFITNNTINLLKSNNTEYFRYNNLLAENLIRRSVLISGTGERMRNKIFLSLKNKIKETLDYIESSP